MRYACWLAMLAVVVLALGCGGEEFMTTDMTAVANDDGFTLVVSAAPDNLNIQTGGAISVMISVTDPAGEGVESAVVVLSATMGTLTETELTTDMDGFAVTTLTAPDLEGYGVVVGSYRGIQAMVQIDFWTSSTGGTG
ncbi:MAG: hypothetical protein P9L99_18105 [Candidatus Lernaella stagnicola]|nr:hypothetical protein [Candidatus Lernaella stagnicola]